MKKKLHILSFLIALCVNVFAQNVSDVAFYQEGKNIVVTYSLDKVASVTVQVSTDGGATYSAPLKHVSGDVGKDVTAGAKQIVWDVLAEYDSFTGDNVVFLVKAVGETHKYVDLGLPSGTLWAECNVGANFPEEKGDYFAWGETSPKRKYTKKNYIVDYNITSLDASHDAATVNWGENWRMPTAAELEELQKECKWKWTEYRGTKGLRIIGKNGNFIFLPAAGQLHQPHFENGGCFSHYWSSSNSDYEEGPYCLMIFGLRGGWGIMLSNWRYEGYSIRPVYSSTK